MSKLAELYVCAHTEDLETKLERSRLLGEVIDEANKTILKRIRMLEYQTDSLGDRWKDIRLYEESLKEKKRTIAAAEHNNLFLFVTINPKPTVTLEELKTASEKLVNRQMFSAYALAFEQRASAPEEAGKGFHVHILMRRNLNYKPCRIKKNMCNTIKNICNVHDSRVFNVQFIGEDFARDKMKYITGGKTGDGKDQKMDIDDIFRKNSNLEKIYEKGQMFQNNI